MDGGGGGVGSAAVGGGERPGERGGDRGAAAAAGGGLSTANTPADFLKSIRGRPVVVKLNSGVDYRGEHIVLSVELLDRMRDGIAPLVLFFQSPQSSARSICAFSPLFSPPLPAFPCPQCPNGRLAGRRVNMMHFLALFQRILACLDGYMNIAMEQTEEYVNGQLKNKYGDAFIRGNNVLYISTTKRTLTEQ